VVAQREGAEGSRGTSRQAAADQSTFNAHLPYHQVSRSVDIPHVKLRSRGAQRLIPERTEPESNALKLGGHV